MRTPPVKLNEFGRFSLTSHGARCFSILPGLSENLSSPFLTYSPYMCAHKLRKLLISADIWAKFIENHHHWSGFYGMLTCFDMFRHEKIWKNRELLKYWSVELLNCWTVLVLVIFGHSLTVRCGSTRFDLATATLATCWARWIGHGCSNGIPRHSRTWCTCHIDIYILYI